MNYRQWKKNYKKLHGYNPLVCDDKRRRNKQMANQLISLISSIDVTKIFNNIQGTIGYSLIRAGELLIEHAWDDVKCSGIVKENSHIVIKREDALRYLTEAEYHVLEEMLIKISIGRVKDYKKPINNYYICNTDEPYADRVKGVIISGEYAKEREIK